MKDIEILYHHYCVVIFAFITARQRQSFKCHLFVGRIVEDNYC